MPQSIVGSGCTAYGAKRLSSTTGCGVPVVSLCQWASVPSPRDETRPMPVMTTSFWLIAGSSGSGRLRRDQCIDLGAEVLHQEILVSRGLAVIDFLGPFFQR